MFEYARVKWDLINAGEEHVQLLKEFEEIVPEGKSDASILIFAFDVDGFLNVWVLHDQVSFRKLETSFETISQLVKLLFMPLNVCVDRNSSFHKAAFATGFIPSTWHEPANKKASEKSAANRINLSDQEILKNVFQDIFGSVVELFKGNKLIVVPHKSLFFTPFSALIDENGRYLSDRYSIQITPSLHTLKCSIEQSRDSKLGFALFVGNPGVGTVSLNGQEVSIADLPYAADEVKCLAVLFQATPLLGRKARKQVVLELLSGASLIHIAAHGEATRGEIMLAPNSSPGEPCSSVPKPESYLLTQEDIMNVSVKARLVVLCCCHTGLGKISSESVIGITRAFMAAGARSVLATLWPINDYATKEFMEKFYDELCQETSVCEALKRTKNFFQLHEKEHYKSFRIWAPFTIYGEDVKFAKDEIEEIRERSHKMFRDLVVLP